MTIAFALPILASLALSCASGPCTGEIPDRDARIRTARELADEDGRFIELDGLLIHYKRYPYTGPEDRAGPPLVLLHGFGASLDSWRRVAVPLAAYGDVLAYDRPAFGLSERPQSWEGPNPYAPDSQADILFSLLDELGYEDAVLVGHSAGARVAVDAARARPDRVAALVLSAPALESGGPPRWVVGPLSCPALEWIGLSMARSLSSSGERTLARAYHDPASLDAETLEAYRRPLALPDWDEALWAFTKATTPPRLPLEAVEVPCIVVSGDDDSILGPGSGRRAAEALGAAFVELRDCGHLPHEERSEAFLEAVGDFLFSLPR